MERSSHVRSSKPVDSDVSVRLASTSPDPSEFKSSSVFKRLDDALKDDTENSAEKAPGIFSFKIHNKEGKEAFWVVNTSGDKGNVTFNGKENPDVTFIISDEDAFEILSGKLYPPRAYFLGKMQITGNLSMAMKTMKFLKNAIKKMEDSKL